MTRLANIALPGLKPLGETRGEIQAADSLATE